MSFFGPDLRNALAIGLGGIATLFSGRGEEQAQGDLLCENGDHLVQEDGGLILLE
jgi:hypothetical protein